MMWWGEAHRRFQLNYINKTKKTWQQRPEPRVRGDGSSWKDAVTGGRAQRDDCKTEPRRGSALASVNVSLEKQ